MYLVKLQVVLSNETHSSSNLSQFPQRRVSKMGRTRLPLEVGKAVLIYWPDHVRWSEAVITGETLSLIQSQLG